MTTFPHRFRLLLSLLALVLLLTDTRTAVADSISASGNLIQNGNFSQGFTGFTTDYTQVANDAPTACWNPNTATIGTSASACHPLWVDPTHAGAMLIMNGADDPPVGEIVRAPRAGQQTAYSSTASVVAGRTYAFTAWLTNLCCNFPAGYDGPALSWWINGQLLGLGQTAGAGVSVLSEFLWTATTTALVSLELKNDQTEFRGNDYGLQDVALREIPTTPTPEPATLLLVGMGAGYLGVGKYLRRARNSR